VFILEFFDELLLALDVLDALAESKKISKPVRLLIVTALFGGLAAAWFAGGFYSIERNETALAVFTWVAGFAFVVIWLLSCKWIVKPRKKDK